jgi:hypothetical protein
VGHQKEKIMGTVSEKRIAANRENAKKSTGPRTALGKSISAANSLVHGIFARHAVITGPPLFENPLEFVRLLEGIRAAFAPRGPFENALVEKIALAQWYEARVARYHAAVTKGQLHDAAAGNGRTLEMEALDGSLPHQSVLMVGATKVNSDAVSVQAAFVERLFDGTANADDDVFLQHVWQSEVQDSKNLDDPPDWRTKAKLHVEALDPAERAKLNERIKTLAFETLEQAEKVYSRDVALEVGLERALLPEDAELNKIMRYSNQLARQGERLFNQLMKVQEVRRKREKHLE